MDSLENHMVIDSLWESNTDVLEEEDFLDEEKEEEDND